MFATLSRIDRGLLIGLGLSVLAGVLVAMLLHGAGVDEMAPLAMAGAFPVAAYGVADASLRKSKALPSAASSSTYTDPIDLGHDNQFIADVEFRLVVPALTTTMLPDTRTATYSIQMDTAEAFGSPTTLYPSVVIQTGAGAAGAAATEYRFKVPSNVERFIRAGCTLGASTTDSSAKSMTLELLR